MPVHSLYYPFFSALKYGINLNMVKSSSWKPNEINNNMHKRENWEMWRTGICEYFCRIL